MFAVFALLTVVGIALLSPKIPLFLWWFFLNCLILFECWVDVSSFSRVLVSTTDCQAPLPQMELCNLFIFTIVFLGNNARNLCNDCEENKVLEQYASTAYSPMPSKPTGNNAPHQATGFPDAEHCNVNPLAWNPDTIFVNDDDHDKLYIEVGFKEAVVPTAITIWVCWGANNAFSDIKLIYTDGSVESIGNGTAQCDSPYTKPLYVKKKVSKVRIHISQPHTSIDAIKLISDVGHPNCSKCESLRYVISRKPPFDTGVETEVHTTYYEDR